MKILIVDDNEDSVECISHILQECNCDIQKAYNGKSAILMTKKYLPDLVLLDVMMPDINGFEVCRTLINDPSTTSIPIIMVTAKTGYKDLEKGLGAGAYDYVKKPFEPNELLARVMAALRYKKNHDELIEAKQSLEEVNERLAQLAITDSLTKIYNHTFLLNTLKFEFKRTQRFAKSLAFLMIDIDHFKDINDNYGHMIGDDVLKEVVQIIQNPIRAIDILGRYGGEEFGLILPETDEKGAMVLAEKIRENVEDHIFIAGEGTVKLRLAISIGVSIYPYKNVKDVKSLVKNADDALYISKREGRNKVSVIN